MSSLRFYYGDIVRMSSQSSMVNSSDRGWCPDVKVEGRIDAVHVGRPNGWDYSVTWLDAEGDTLYYNESVLKLVRRSDGF